MPRTGRPRSPHQHGTGHGCPVADCVYEPRRVGRPPIANPRTEVVRYRLTADELVLLTSAANNSNRTPTEYAREVMLRQAMRDAS